MFFFVQVSYRDRKCSEELCSLVFVSSRSMLMVSLDSINNCKIIWRVPVPEDVFHLISSSFINCWPRPFPQLQCNYCFILKIALAQMVHTVLGGLK